MNIHLVKRRDEQKPSGLHTAIYIFVRNIEKVYSELKEKGAIITNPLNERDYGMRDFDIQDPDGYIIAFGQG